jgi:hypothetical protein
MAITKHQDSSNFSWGLIGAIACRFEARPGFESRLLRPARCGRKFVVIVNVLALRCAGRGRVGAWFNVFPRYLTMVDGKLVFRSGMAALSPSKAFNIPYLHLLFHRDLRIFGSMYHHFLILHHLRSRCARYHGIISFRAQFNPHRLACFQLPFSVPNTELPTNYHTPTESSLLL